MDAFGCVPYISAENVLSTEDVIFRQGWLALAQVFGLTKQILRY